ncbi:D-2-hydroxyacid dehydrogenase [Haloglomus litoreum]|uniref:D-2-hydroxyacid dehydrogenase n=1 Tax=Haloglomus litoreum TaxID=3034026 RepID=UPI0023E87355|nr:D-2-hydroxyacid dehydrogenase [Haloglomus sp. DT116]
MPYECSQIGLHESIDAIFSVEALREELADIDPEVTVIGDDREAIAACDAVVTRFYLDAYAEEVEWLHAIQSGVDRFPLDELEEAGVVLTNSAGIHGTAVGEMVTGYLLALAHGIHDHVRNAQDGEWDRPAWNDAFTLPGHSLCVVGLGTLGQGIAERAAKLGMDVTGVKRTVEPVEYVDEVYPASDLVPAVSEADFVALAVPLTDETRHLVGAAELDAMRDDAYLVNVARGPVVDEAALVDALREGRLAGAALDVFEEEPLPEDSPLWDLENAILTPHCASITQDYPVDVAALVRENLGRDPDEFTNRVV